LDLVENNLGGSIPEEIKALSHLEELYLSNKSNGDDPTINGKSLSFLASLTSLKIFDFSGNGVDFTIPSEFGRLTNLERLHLNDNKFKFIIPDELNNLVNLKQLFLNQNRLVGSADDALEMMESLEELDLSSNAQLWVTENFKLPTSLKSLKMERILQTGTEIWTTIGRLSNLEVLSLESSNVSGSLPTEFGLLTSLQELNLRVNTLSGTIPSTMGAMISLKELDLHANKLHGEVPTELGLLKSLSK
jgi:Leucine-rich repeat (LRR) protein